MAMTVYKEKGSATVNGSIDDVATGLTYAFNAIARGGGSNGTIQFEVMQNGASAAKASVKASETDDGFNVATVVAGGATPGIVDHGAGASPRLTVTLDSDDAPKFRIKSGGSLAWQFQIGASYTQIQGNGFVDFDLDAVVGGG